MLSANRLRNAVLLLALVLGQWLTFAHAQQHPAFGAAEKACVYCVHAPGLDAGAATPAPALAAERPARHETPLAPRPAAARTILFSAAPIRGPPAFLVLPA